VARPAARPCSRLRWIVSNPIGPIGAAIDKPITTACADTAAHETPLPKSAMEQL